MHLKRQKTPKNWPIPRKGSAFIARPNYALEKGIPVLIILRDILKLGQNRKEVKKAIHSKNILLNNKAIKDEKNPALLFDIIKNVASDEYYKVELSGFGKFKLEKVKEEEGNEKVAKIINKKMLKGKKQQLNLSDGRNYISDLKCKINDSVLIDLKKNKIEKCFPLKENSKIIVFAGKHSGKQGIIRKIKPERKMASITVGKEDINVLIKQLMVVK